MPTTECSPSCGQDWPHNNEYLASPVGNKSVDETESPVATPESGYTSREASPASIVTPINISNGGVKHLKGPDVVLPAEKLSSWHRSQPTKLRTPPVETMSEKPMSLVTYLRTAAKKFKNNTALAKKVDGKWRTWTYAQYLEDVVTAAKALIELGLEPEHGVGILGFNSPEWFITNMSAIFAGGLAVGIYATNSPESCHYVASNADCNIIVVENDNQLQKILKIRDELPNLRSIVQYNGQLTGKYPNVYSWKDFMAIGRKCNDEKLNERIDHIAINKCCCLIYTSGTTGNPKGVMLHHDNLVWVAQQASRWVKISMGKEILVSYLPLSHIAAQVLDIYIPIYSGAAVYFAQPDALKGSLVDTLREVRPTIFLGVPRVWEKIQEKMIAAGSSRGLVSRMIVGWAKSVGYYGNLSRMKGNGVPFGWTLANTLVFKKVRKALGMDRCHMCMSAAAPIARETVEYFISMDITILEVFGMSESTGPHTSSLPTLWRLGSAGPPIKGCSIKVHNADKEGNGEIFLNGRNIFMGYLDEETKTNETITEDGWLCSGDIGTFSKDGFLYITGRIKELLITAGGENVAPVPIEDAVKEALPCISNCMLVGDRRKFLSILLTIKTEVDPMTSEPLDQLAPATITWCKNIGCKFETVSDILRSRDQKWTKAIDDGISLANKKSPSRAQLIQKWSVLPRDFSVSGGELGPTLKLRRPIVAKMYQSTIEQFYV